LSELQKTKDLLSDTKIDESLNLRELLNKEFCLGMTRHVCRHGTLGEGHEKITDAQRYYQSIKEVYTRAVTLIQMRASLLELEAELLEVEEMPEGKKSQVLRKEAARMKAELRLKTTKIEIEDTFRQLDEFDKVRRELGPRVKEKYPHGIEQAEVDNWKAVARFRQLKNPNNNLNNIPLSDQDKWDLADEIGRLDLKAVKLVREPESMKKLTEQLHEQKVLP